MTKIMLKPGDRIEVVLEGTDGEFVIEYGKTALTVTADLPDSEGREGQIYCENFGDTEPRDDVVEPPADERPLRMSADVRDVGLWYTRYRSVTYPQDRGGENWAGKDKFLESLRRVQSTLLIHLARGIERCPCCGEADTISEYSLVGWTWHGKLDHLIEVHGAKPSNGFIRFINTKSDSILQGRRKP